MKKCPYCAEEIQDDAIKCRYCGSILNQTPPPHSYEQYGNGRGGYGNRSPWEANDAFADGPEGRSRGVAALLAILLGALGVHYFYLGKTTGGIVYLILTIFSCGTVSAILGLIQGIMMLCMTNEEFRQRYVLTPSSFPF